MSQHPIVYRISLFFAATAVFVFATHCGGGTPVHLRPDAGAATLSGVVVKGRIASATVTAYPLSPTGDRGTALASATTDASGAFTLAEVPSYNGPLLLVAMGGAYAEEAVAGANINLDTQELTYLIGSYSSGTSVQNLAITPVSHLATGLALHSIQVEHQPVAQAASDAWSHLSGHFGGVLGNLDWQTVTPLDPTAAGSGQLNAAGRAGVLLAALSMEARTFAERAGITPGAGLSSIGLVEALYEDIRSDGFFDGQGYQGRQLVLPPGGFVADAGPSATPLDGQTLRFALGQSIDRFIHSNRNQSGLTLNDVLPMIYQVTSNSDARIFRSSGFEYDHDAPHAVFSATFTRDGGKTSHQPVNALKLVGGTVAITVDITDASTIQSVSLTINGEPLNFTTSGSGSHLVLSASFDTTVDGPITLTANVSDVHGNTGAPNYQLTVDNTPPNVNVAAGSPLAGAYYNSAVPVDVTASDVNGVSAFSLKGLNNFANLSGVIERITGTWQVSATQPDGPLTATFTAIDNAFNVTALPLTLNIDRTPPSVALAQPLPPRYTSSSSITLRVTASDLGSGVSAVKASVNGAPETTVTASQNGVWDLPVDLGLEGNKRILIWAVDRTLPSSNTGYSTALSLDLTRDATNPAPIVRTDFGSYFDERPAIYANGSMVPGMSLELDPSGNPLVPAIYTFPAGVSKRPVAGATDVYKASSRLSWGPIAPTIQQLYNQDGVTLNVPFLVYDVPVTNSQAPIRPDPTFTVTCTDCDAVPTTTGQLLRDPSANGDPQRFILPLSVDYIPGLGNINRVAHLKVEATFTDQAGNAGYSVTTLAFHVVSPPLNIQQDGTYPFANDPKSVFAYHTGPARNYADLFNPTNPSFSNGRVRAFRYIVKNPSPVPVVLRPSLDSGSYVHSESWSDVIRNADSGIYPDAPGAFTWSACTNPPFDPDPPPCGGLRNFGLYQGILPNTCNPPSASIPPESTTQNSPSMVASGSLAVLDAYVGTTDATPASQVASIPGSYVVPAATGTTPGVLTIYVNRPANVTRTLPIARVDVLLYSYAPLGSDSYSYTVEDFWYPSGPGRYCCTNDPDFPICYNRGTQDYALRRHAKSLASATTSISGLMSFGTQPFDIARLQVTGESIAIITSQSFTTTISH